MFGAHPHPAPPEDRAPFDQIVQPGLADLGRRQRHPHTLIGHRPQERKRARDVIVDDDQGLAQAFMHIVGDLAQIMHDSLMGPPFERAPDIDADDLAENACIHPLEIIQRPVIHLARLSKTP